MDDRLSKDSLSLSQYQVGGHFPFRLMKDQCERWSLNICLAVFLGFARVTSAGVSG